MGIEVFVANEQSEFEIDSDFWLKFAVEVLQSEKVSPSAELSLMFVDQPAITGLNEKFMGKVGPTDVLSFPIEIEPVASGRSPDSGNKGPGSFSSESEIMPFLLGDVVVCPEIANENAPDHAGNGLHDGSLDDEIALLVVHGILHLLGMDHELDDEAALMEAREQELLSLHYRKDTRPGAI